MKEIEEFVDHKDLVSGEIYWTTNLYVTPTTFRICRVGKPKRVKVILGKYPDRSWGRDVYIELSSGKEDTIWASTPFFRTEKDIVKYYNRSLQNSLDALQSFYESKREELESRKLKEPEE